MYLLVVIFVLIVLLYFINVRENFSGCYDNIDQGVMNSLNDVNNGLAPLGISPINLPCDI